jgi:hypothetical protein
MVTQTGGGFACPRSLEAFDGYPSGNDGQLQQPS